MALITGRTDGRPWRRLWYSSQESRIQDPIVTPDTPVPGAPPVLAPHTSFLPPDPFLRLFSTHDPVVDEDKNRSPGRYLNPH